MCLAIRSLFSTIALPTRSRRSIGVAMGSVSGKSGSSRSALRGLAWPRVDTQAVTHKVSLKELERLLQSTSKNP